MKKLIIIFTLACSIASAETKADAELRELRKQLAAARAALSVAEAHAKDGTRKLAEAVTDGTEASKENGKKIEAVADQIEAAKETVETQAKLNERATRRLADTVATSTGKMTSAISEQAQQQAHAAAGARDIARKVDRTNTATTKAQQAYLTQTAKLEKAIAELTQKAELKDASNQTSIQLAKIQAYSSMYGPISVVMVGVFGLFGIWIQARNGRKLTKISGTQDVIKTQVNGNLADAHERANKKDAEIAGLRAEIDKLRNGN